MFRACEVCGHESPLRGQKAQGDSEPTGRWLRPFTLLSLSLSHTHTHIFFQIEIRELDEFAQAAFQGYKSLNRVQSRIFQATYYTNENILVRH